MTGASSAEIVIVGAGAAGLTTAIFARRANPDRSVLLLMEPASPARRSSSAVEGAVMSQTASYPSVTSGAGAVRSSDVSFGALPPKIPSISSVSSMCHCTRKATAASFCSGITFAAQEEWWTATSAARPKASVLTALSRRVPTAVAAAVVRALDIDPALCARRRAGRLNAVRTRAAGLSGVYVVVGCLQGDSCRAAERSARALRPPASPG